MAATIPSRRMAIGAARTDWPGVIWITPLRYAIVCATLVAFALTYASVPVAVGLSIGSLFTAVADPRGPFPRRLRAMVLAALMVAAAAGLGVVASEPKAVYIGASIVVAAICGYLGVASPRAAVAGVLALVTFIVYSGTPEPLGSAPTVLLWVLLGGAVQIALLFLLRLFGRMDGMRAELGIAYRGLGLALRDPRIGPSAIQAVARINAARGAARESDAEGESRAWLLELVERCDRARIGLLALRSERRHLDAEATGRVIALDDAAAALSLAIASALLGTGRRVAVARQRARLAAAVPADGTLPPAAAALIREIAAELDAAAELVERPWPTGRRGRASYALGISAEPFRRLLRRDDPDRMFLRHAIRLAVLIGLATAAATLDPLGHSYWIPLTVAWVTKPDFAGTAVRIFSRVGGTLIGVFVATTVLGLVGGSQGAVIALVGASAFAAFAFMQPNYAICTAGVTSYVLALFFIAGDPLVDTALLRIFGTVVAAIGIWIAIRAWPTRTGGHVCLALADQARSLARYGSALHSGDVDVAREHRAELIDRRVRADAAIAAAALEPGRHVLHDADARAIFDDLVEASGVVATVDLTDDPTARATLSDRALAALFDVGERLEALETTGRPAPRRTPPDPADTLFSRSIESAHGHVDVLLGAHSGVS